MIGQILSGLLLVSGLFNSGVEEKTVTLEDLKWKYRVIVIFADSISSDSYMKILQENEDHITDRDISWFVILNDTTISNQPLSLFKETIAKLSAEQKNKKHSILLLGKDGGIKWSDNSLKLQNIFNLIDKMPMRIREMRMKE